MRFIQYSFLLPALALGGCYPEGEPTLPVGCGDSTPYYPDVDGDGYGDAAATPGCVEAPDLVPLGGDCDDEDPAISPGTIEACDGVDSDCDGGAEAPSAWYVDDDGDGFGVTGSEVVSCYPLENTSPLGGDCDDEEILTYPGAPEACDGEDRDCDGAIDEGAEGWTFQDSDGDGYGNIPLSGCAGGVPLRGDCEDLDPAVHPGAEDTEGDGIDGDCGGSDGPDPHVGFGRGSVASIQEALSGAEVGRVIWVAPGVYEEVDLSYEGKALRLASVGGADLTIVDAQGQGRVLRFDGGELGDSILDGFTLRGGRAVEGQGGGGVYIRYGSPTLIDVTIDGCQGGRGGGLMSENGSPVLRRLRVEKCTADTEGGGLAFVDSTYVLEDGVTVGNVAGGFGGGIFAERSEGTVKGHRVVGNVATLGGGGGWMDNSGGAFTEMTFQGNRALGEVGGLHLFLSTSSFQDPQFIGNSALGGPAGGLSLKTASIAMWEGRFLGNMAMGDGGGIRLEDTSLALEGTQHISNRAAQGGGGMSVYRAYVVAKEVLFQDNRAIGGYGSHGGAALVNDAGFDVDRGAFEGNAAGGFDSGGGGIMAIGSSPSLFNTLFYGNQAAGYGGALYLNNSSPYLYFTTLVSNRAAFGGAMAMIGRASPQLNTSIVAYNSPYNLYSCCFEDGQEGPAPYLLFTNLYNPEGMEDVDPPYIDASNPEVEPGFLTYNESGWPTDIHLSVDSPLVDEGDPTFIDADWSQADMGYFGGDGGGRMDLDRDGLPGYFWPGTFEDIPLGLNQGAFDKDDRDPLIQ